MRADLLGGVEQFGSVSCQKRLVCGDHIAARIQCLKNVGSGRFDAAHDFDDDVGTENEALDVCCDEFGRETLWSGSLCVSNRDTNEFKLCTDSGCQFGLVFGQQARHLSSNRAGPEQGYAQWTILNHDLTLSSSLGSEGLW